MGAEQIDYGAQPDHHMAYCASCAWRSFWPTKGGAVREGLDHLKRTGHQVFIRSKVLKEEEA